MNQTHIVSVVTKSKFYFPYLQKSCIKNNIALEVIGFGQQWMGFAWRYTLMLEYLRKLQLYDIVCFIDGYDVISVRNLLELKNEFLKIKFRENCKIIVGHNVQYDLTSIQNDIRSYGVTILKPDGKL